MKLLILFLLSIQLLLAAPAFHGKRTFIQPDGTEVTYRLQGDEHLNWMESQNGDILLYSKKNKRFEYAEIKKGTLKASGVIFSKAKTANAPAASAARHSKISKKDLHALYEKRRAKHLSKMQSRHKEHSDH